jgi:anti-sigma28 factor (negative regulator of flagellin synthesis)
MRILSHRSKAERTSGETIRSSSGEPARLETIHEAVRSGVYHVPATAIADCMIEHIMVSKRANES